MEIRISPSDGVPIYQQIVNQVKYLIASRRLGAGEEIPPIRLLAQQLLINPNTVARAYLELEREGVVVKKHGSGTYVSDGGSPLARRERLKILQERIDALVAEASHLGIGLDDVSKLLEQRHELLNPARK